MFKFLPRCCLWLEHFKLPLHVQPDTAALMWDEANNSFTNFTDRPPGWSSSFILTQVFPLHDSGLTTWGCDPGCLVCCPHQSRPGGTARTQRSSLYYCPAPATTDPSTWGDHRTQQYCLSVPELPLKHSVRSTCLLCKSTVDLVDHCQL